MFSLGVPSSCTIRSTWWISEVPGRRGLWASSSARTQPMALGVSRLSPSALRDGTHRGGTGSHGPGSEVTGDWPRDWVPACLGDHEGRACLPWTSVPGVREQDPRLRSTSWKLRAVKEPGPTPVPTCSHLTCPPRTSPRPDSGPRSSPHVDAGGLRGGAQQQFGGSVPADRSTPPRVRQFLFSGWGPTGLGGPAPAREPETARVTRRRFL